MEAERRERHRKDKAPDESHLSLSRREEIVGIGLLGEHITEIQKTHLSENHRRKLHGNCCPPEWEKIEVEVSSQRVWSTLGGKEKHEVEDARTLPNVAMI